MTLDILLVDDDELVGRTVQRLLPPQVRARSATTKVRAIELLREREWPCGLALIDVNLGSERLAGLDVLEIALAERPQVRCALFTGSIHPEVVRCVFVRDVQIVPKPLRQADLVMLLDRARTGDPIDPLRKCVDSRSLEWRLSATQKMILKAVVANGRRTNEEVACALGMNVNTLRSHVRELLCRSQFRSLDELISSLLRDALDVDASSGRV